MNNETKIKKQRMSLFLYVTFFSIFNVALIAVSPYIERRALVIISMALGAILAMIFWEGED